jgi:hypothetical protein
MPKFTVSLRTYAFTSVEVEADSADEAVDAAYEADLPTICAQCAGWGRDNEPGLELNEAWEADSVSDEHGKVVLDLLTPPES